jgi:hypothetical protein
MDKKELRVALIGHQFMGVAHSNAFLNAEMWTNMPVKIKMKCLCANDSPDNLKDFAERGNRKMGSGLKYNLFKK